MLAAPRGPTQQGEAGRRELPPGPRDRPSLLAAGLDRELLQRSSGRMRTGQEVTRSARRWRDRRGLECDWAPQTWGCVTSFNPHVALRERT